MNHLVKAPVNYEKGGRSYLGDPITVQTVLLQAHSAYLRGCLDHIDLPKGERYSECNLRAKRYIEDEVVSILEQGH